MVQPKLPVRLPTSNAPRPESPIPVVLSQRRTVSNAVKTTLFLVVAPAPRLLHVQGQPQPAAARNEIAYRDSSTACLSPAENVALSGSPAMGHLRPRKTGRCFLQGDFNASATAPEIIGLPTTAKLMCPSSMKNIR